MKAHTQSTSLFESAKTYIPGGVNSPVRAFNSVHSTPVYIEKSKGAILTDADGNEYIDFCSSWGPTILGHAPDTVVSAIQEATENGITFGACTSKEVELASIICEQIPEIDMVRMVNSGTEATMTALRLARGFTKRDKILKFSGCYHGHTDYLLVASGSGLLTQSISSSAGVTQNAIKDMLIAPYNDLEAVKTIINEFGDDLAAIIVEPVAGNMGLIEPSTGFLEALRDLTIQCGALLIFDEVITGFRFAPTSFANTQDITPDLTCLGKIIGGGLPIGAIGGKKEIMEHLAPLGDVYQAGTLSGNPVALAAGITTLTQLVENPPYSHIDALCKQLANGFNTIAKENNYPVYCSHKGSVFTIFFTSQMVMKNIQDVQTNCNLEHFATWHNMMLDKGCYLSPSQFELNFISAAHTQEHIQEFLTHAQTTLQTIFA